MSKGDAMWRSNALAVLTLSGAVCWAIGAPNISAQAALTQPDYTEIQQLYAKYAHTIDSGDAAGWARTFTVDGVFGNAKGTEKLEAFAKDFYQRFKGDARHWYSQLLIAPAPEGAKGSCYFTLLDVKTKATVASGIYQDTLVKTAGGWRFKERVATADKASAP
jgi:hypothetical protein